MSDQTHWSGNLPEMIGQPEEDPIECYRKSLQTVLGRKLAKGQTIGRIEAEVLFALAERDDIPRICPDDD